MLKFSVGYAPTRRGSFAAMIEPYAHRIEEVYYAPVHGPSGRGKPESHSVLSAEELHRQMTEDLLAVRARGIRTDLLFNANCYGADAMSRTLSRFVCHTVEQAGREGLYPETVTTTSPIIAAVIKEHFPDIRLKASVNMKIGTIKGMEYTAHLFDEYCLEKECNREPECLKQLHDWAVSHGKRLTILANSGCMRHCAGQIFHDNMVAHEDEIAARDNLGMLPYLCWNYLKDPRHFVSVLQNTWVRPEDIRHYEGLVDTVKLATRSHALPGLVIGAYVRGHYDGNLLDLFEPGYAPAFVPYVLDSSKIPADFWQVTTACNKACESCSYCQSVLDKALVGDDSFDC